MIGVRQVVLGLMMGAVLIAFGMIPGLFDGVAEGLRNLDQRRHFHVPTRTPIPVDPPRWFAVAGVALIALALTAYFSG